MKITINNDREFNSIKHAVATLLQSMSAIPAERFARKMAIKADPFLIESQDAMICYLDAPRRNLTPQQIKWLDDQAEWLANWMYCEAGKDY